eukprot:TRINITY_DN1908_c1_g1_i1.p1 TRINITY_DN1908_c1_g1~~TRINITY_DN1908_c1_g1_i1.p1  ORF type:complete len:176 (-),score=28.49 TRINITY_DN1908_c1_g1_i1:136-663(-)
MLHESADGNKDFDVSLQNPLTSDTVKSWYKPGQTYDSVFGPMGSTFEECRAECVGLVLSHDKEFLKVLDVDEEKSEPITYVNWIYMVENGLRALQYYDSDKKKWGQAHMQARFGILKTLLQAGEGLLTLDVKEDDLTIKLDRTKITSVGVPAINTFLQKIQIYKATADIEAAKKF